MWPSTPRQRRLAMRRGSLALVVSLSVVLGGCTGQPAPGGRPGSTAPGTPTATAPGQPEDPIERYAAGRLADMSLTEKVASLLMLHCPGTDAATLRGFVDAYGLGGLILMGDNVPASTADMAAMTSAVSADPALPVLLGIDEEGGSVSRLAGDTAPGGRALAALPAPATTEAFTSRSTLLQSAGVNVNFGIVADVTADPAAFLYDRVLGSDPNAAAERVAAAVAGERGRVVSTLKHFPGHGAAAGDSHQMIPTTGIGHAEWLSQVAPPFRSGIAAGADMVMFGHLAYPTVDPRPASLSPAWHEILRTELGFDGVAITDDMLMLGHTRLPEYADPTENAVAALAAGNTMLLYVLPADPATEGIDVAGLIAGVAAAVESGRIPAAQIDDDVLRLLELRHRIARGPVAG